MGQKNKKRDDFMATSYGVREKRKVVLFYKYKSRRERLFEYFLAFEGKPVDSEKFARLVNSASLAIGTTSAMAEEVLSKMQKLGMFVANPSRPDADKGENKVPETAKEGS